MAHTQRLLQSMFARRPPILCNCTFAKRKPATVTGAPRGVFASDRATRRNPQRGSRQRARRLPSYRPPLTPRHSKRRPPATRTQPQREKGNTAREPPRGCLPSDRRGKPGRAPCGVLASEGRQRRGKGEREALRAMGLFSSRQQERRTRAKRPTPADLVPAGAGAAKHRAAAAAQKDAAAMTRHRYGATGRERLPARQGGCRTGESRTAPRQREAAPAPDQRERGGCRGIRGTRAPTPEEKAACWRPSATPDRPQGTHRKRATGLSPSSRQHRHARHRERHAPADAAADRKGAETRERQPPRCSAPGPAGRVRGDNGD